MLGARGVVGAVLVALFTLAACDGGGRTFATGSGGSTSTTGTGGAGTSTSGTGGVATSSSSSTSSGTGSSSSGTMGPCAVFLPDSPWNTDVSGEPVDPASAAFVKSIGDATHLHPDFGTVYGIPYQYVNSSVAKSTVTFDYADESDPGPYPIPPNPLIEDGGDAHLLMIQTDECVLYELYGANHQSDGWYAGSGSIWDLKTNSTRPTCWTSADAAGLPIYPGLARYEEVAKGEINHALRFTVSTTQAAFVPPASHFASSDTDPTLPPMGLRLRLKQSYDISAAPPQSKIILTALKKYGMIVADNGSDWFVSGAPDPGWDDNDLDYIKTVPGSAFEAIEIKPGTLTTSCP